MQLSFRAKRSVVEKPAELPLTFAAGCLDFARHDTIQGYGTSIL